MIRIGRLFDRRDRSPSPSALQRTPRTRPDEANPPDSTESSTNIASGSRSAGFHIVSVVGLGRTASTKTISAPTSTSLKRASRLVRRPRSTSAHRSTRRRSPSPLPPSPAAVDLPSDPASALPLPPPIRPRPITQRSMSWSGSPTPPRSPTPSTSTTSLRSPPLSRPSPLSSPPAVLASSPSPSSSPSSPAPPAPLTPRLQALDLRTPIDPAAIHTEFVRAGLPVERVRSIPARRPRVTHLMEQHAEFVAEVGEWRAEAAIPETDEEKEEGEEEKERGLRKPGSSSSLRSMATRKRPSQDTLCDSPIESASGETLCAYTDEPEPESEAEKKKKKKESKAAPAPSLEKLIALEKAMSTPTLALPGAAPRLDPAVEPQKPKARRAFSLWPSSFRRSLLHTKLPVSASAPASPSCDAPSSPMLLPMSASVASGLHFSTRRRTNSIVF